MWVKELLLGILGLSFGMGVAAGLFSFIIGLGVVSDFADRTHTGNYIRFYEDCLAMGGILGNIFWLWEISLPVGQPGLLVFGLFTGIFVGSWSMALAEALNIFPILIRRTKMKKYAVCLVLAMALGKGAGSIVYFINRW